jgi:hypothetical protein
MTGFVFYHQNCFNLRPNRYGEKGIHFQIQQFISDYHGELKRLGHSNFIRPYPKKITVESYKYSKTYCEKRNGNFSEEELSKLTDVDLIHICRNLNWFQISIRFKFEYPEHFWKIAPYFQWKDYFDHQKNNENLEAIVNTYYKHFDINLLKKDDMTKSLMLRFTNKIDWFKYSSSKHFDMEILKKTADSYELDWISIFNKFTFSDYLLDKLLNKIGWTYLDLFNKTDHKIPIKKVIANLRHFFKNNYYKTLRNYQIPSLNLDQNIHGDYWPLIKQYQTKLEPWFIQKHYQNLVDKIPAKKESVKAFLTKQNLLPALEFSNNDYKVVLYDSSNPPQDNNQSRFYLPDSVELAKGRLIYHIGRSIKKRFKKGLIFYKNKQYHNLFNPWMYYPNAKRLVIKPEKDSLRKVLRRNGYGKTTNRPKAFNDFLLTNNLL